MYRSKPPVAPGPPVLSPSLSAPSCQISVLTTLSFQMAGAGQSWQRDAADQNFDYMFKLLIIGNSSVGKTSFLFR